MPTKSLLIRLAIPLVIAVPFLSNCIGSEGHMLPVKSMEDCYAEIPKVLRENDLSLNEITFTFRENGECSSTCWKGPIPGLSDLAQVLDTLEKQPFVNHDRTTVTETIPNHIEVDWGNAIPEEKLARGLIRLENGKVTFIETPLNYGFSLEEAISVLGQPDGYTLVPHVGVPVACYAIGLVWKERRLEIVSYYFPGGTQIELTSLAERIQLFDKERFPAANGQTRIVC